MILLIAGHCGGARRGGQPELRTVMLAGYGRTKALHVLRL
jgi:hypothetical protein